MAAMMLRRHKHQQLSLDLKLESGSREMEKRWRDTEENEKRSRTRFAQNALKPAEVAPEWEKSRDLLGGPEEARSFVAAAMKRFDAPLEPRQSTMAAHVHALPPSLRDRLEQRGLVGTEKFALSEPAPAGTSVLTRTHPLTATLAEALVEGALDPSALPGSGIGRVGAWPTGAVRRKTLIALLRLRFKLTVHGRRERLLLAEEAGLVALAGTEVIAAGVEVRALLGAEATHNLAAVARDRIIAEVTPTLLANYSPGRSPTMLRSGQIRCFRITRALGVLPVIHLASRSSLRSHPM